MGKFKMIQKYFSEECAQIISEHNFQVDGAINLPAGQVNGNIFILLNK
jgi:hypothetical protein